MSGYMKFKNNEHSFEGFETSTLQKDEYSSENIYVINSFYVFTKEEQNPKLSQKIVHSYSKDTNLSHTPSFSNYFFFIDVNFDNYKDILILNGFYGAQGSAAYSCWLWNEQLNSYAENDSFSDIPNVSIDPTNKMIL